MSCPDCITGGLLPGEPTGSLSIQGAYLAPGPVNDTTSKRAIVFLTDAFGLPLKNCKILADKLATRLECDVWIPDYFAGKPLAPVRSLLTPDRAGVRMGVCQWLKFIIYTIPSIPAFIQSRPSVADARLSKFINAIKEEKKYEKIGAVGYCYGGSTVIRLGATDLVNSIVICHPGRFSIPEAKAIKVPAAWVCAEEDMFFSHSLRLRAEAIFSERQGTDSFVEYEFKDYKGTAHGFASRPNLNLPEVKEAHEKAFEQVVGWFAKTLAD
ncbi:Hydrolase tropI [Hypsizygus marmoreus]|uniref:Hydrolase tropI n=1 Tax=Hypsizygus marmoreus TaxID=39966 RepID=A0A369K7L3_HYPMA|nr:Hydrolase tropI [Hypsizygus marmoreus]